MSQDDVKCAICSILCGYDDEKGYWEGGNLAICGRCKTNLISKFGAFFGLEGTSSDNYGITVTWQEMNNIMQKVKIDYTMSIKYIVTDKEYFERVEKHYVPIVEDING